VDPVHVVIAVMAPCCWGGAARKLIDLRHNPTNVVLPCLCIAQVSLSVAVSVQAFLPAFDRTLGAVDISRVACNCLTMVAAAGGLVCGYYAAYPEEMARPLARRCVAWMVVTVMAIIGWYVAVGPPHELSDPAVASGAYYETTPSLGDAPYTIVYLAFLTYALVAVSDCPPLVAYGVRTLLVGASLGLGYSATKATAAVLATWDRSWWLIDAAIPAFLLGAVVAVLFGLALPPAPPLRWRGSRIGGRAPGLSNPLAPLIRCSCRGGRGRSRGRRGRSAPTRGRGSCGSGRGRSRWRHPGRAASSPRPDRPRPGWPTRSCRTR
jgi:uncharacterized membrane protein YgcG